MKTMCKPTEKKAARRNRSLTLNRVISLHQSVILGQCEVTKYNSIIVVSPERQLPMVTRETHVRF